MFNKNKIKKQFMVGLLTALISIITVSYNSMAYVMPAEQLLGFVADNFSGYKSVVLIQSVLRTTPDNEKVFSEQINLVSPDKYSTQFLDRLGGRSDSPDLTYLQLIMANRTDKLEHILRAIGVDLKTVSYTRIDGKIAYRIGGKDPDSPKLLIDKESFVPLLLIYKPHGELNDKIVSVRFQAYQKEEKGLYPFEITYNEGESLVERYRVQSIQFNVPVDSSTLQQFPELEIPEEAIDDQEADREDQLLFEKDLLRKIIEASEEQYE
jgi:hypothetical protein